MMNQYSEVPTWFDASRYEAPQAPASPTPNWTSYSSPSASPISSDGYSMSSSPTPSHHNCGNPSVSVTSHAVLGGEGYEVQSTGMNLPMTSEDFREEKIRAHKEQNHRKKAQVKSNELLNSLVNMQYSEEGFEVQPAMQPSGRKMSAREIREAKIRAYKQNKAKNKALLLFDSHKY